MATKTRRKTSKNTSLVPVLFTLGVIGWGFFAIDRLTSSSVPDYKMESIEAHDIVDNSPSYERKSWKEKAENFLSYFKKKDKVELKDDRDFENWHAVMPDEEDKSQNIEEPVQKRSQYTLYFYKEGRKGLSLIPLNKSTSGNISYSEVFSNLINGPYAFGKTEYVDSFPVKPTVIDVLLNKNILSINFDDNFGHGISFETAELQVKQILKTASQFKNIHYVEFLVNSHKVDNISIDGLVLPSKYKIH